MSSPAARTTFRQIWWAPLLCFGLAFAASRLEVVRQSEWTTLDWRIQFRALLQPPADPRIVIVLFEDDTDTNLVSWPPDRAWHGNLNKFMAVEKPAVITWDVILDVSREGDGDAAMAADTRVTIEAGTQVVTGAVTSGDPPEIEPIEIGPTRPLPNVEGGIAGLYGDAHALLPFLELRAAAPYGFVDAPRTGDGVIREVPMVVRVGDKVYASLALQTVMSYYGIEPEQVKVRPGDGVYFQAEGRVRRIPISASGRYLVNYRYDQAPDGSSFDFATHTYREMLLKINAFHVENQPGAPRPPDLEGRIVFVGQTVTGKADAGPTQRNAYAPLVLVHANIVHNILREDYAREVPPGIIWGTALLLGLLGLALLADRSVMILCSGAVLGVVSYGSLAIWAWVLGSWWVPVVGPLTGFIALQFVVIGRRVWQEQKAKQEIKGMFGNYVSPELVERMIRSGRMPQLGGHEEEITAYFSDIQGFSTFSEQLPPDRLVELMNEYLTACTDLVQEEGGTLDKYIGDAVVAMFGAPIALPDHAYRGCVAAIRVQARLTELRAKWRGEGARWPRIVWEMQSRIGLNSGRCVVGNMGSRSRFNYTMMGDDVNLAARMESGAKSWGVYTMCTEATRLACEQHGGDRVVFRPLGRIVVKGRAQAVPIHELVGLRENISAQTWECLELFGRGLARYVERDWEGAIELFSQSARLEPNQPEKHAGVASNPSLVFADISRHYRDEPPPAGWNGTFVMKEK